MRTLPELIGIVSADDPRAFEDHNKRKDEVTTYYIGAFNGPSLVGQGSVEVKTGA
jgi:hypothetical protein